MRQGRRVRKRDRPPSARPSGPQPGQSQSVQAVPTAVLPVVVSPRWATLPCLVLVVLATIWSFAPAIDNEFLYWDDAENFMFNPDIRGLSTENLWAMATASRMGMWQPLSWFLAAAQYQFFGQPGNEAFSRGMHITSIGLHAFASILCFVVMRRLVVLAAPRLAASTPLGINVAVSFATLLFAVHPLRVEVVAWATGQAYILGLIGVLGTVLCYLNAHLRRRRRWHLASLLCLAASLSCKAIAIPIVPLLLVLDAYPLRRFSAPGWNGKAVGRVLIEKIPYALLALVAVGLALWSNRLDRAQWAIQPGPMGVVARMLLASYCMMFCVTVLVVPLKLAPFYMRPIPFDQGDPWFVGAALAFVLITVGLVAFRRRTPWLLAVWMAHVTILLPVSGLVRHGGQLAADRYTYLACIGWLTLIAAGVARLWATRNGVAARGMVLAAASAIVVVLGGAARGYCPVWKDSITVWQAIVDRNPEFDMGHYNLGKAYERAGDAQATARCLRQALNLYPYYPKANVDLGNMLKADSDYDGAMRHYQAALRGQPGFHMAHVNMAYWMCEKERYGEGVRHFELARIEAERVRAEHILAIIDRDLPLARAAAARAESSVPARAP